MKLLLLTLTAIAAQAQAHLVPLPAEQYGVLQPALTEKMLPARGESLTLEPKQAFILAAPGAAPLTLIPAWYFVERGSGETACGLFFGTPGQPPRFLRTYNLYSESWGRCATTSAIGLMPDPGPRPRIILIYNAYSPPRHSWQEAVVLKWDQIHSTYIFDRSLPAPEDVVGVGNITVAQVRRMLVSHPR